LLKKRRGKNNAKKQNGKMFFENPREVVSPIQSNNKKTRRSTLIMFKKTSINFIFA